EAEAMFDALTYEKGASVLRMLEQHLGPEAFRDGIRRYLARHEFGNTETRDLGDALGAADVMEAWVFSPGYPVITVAEAGGRLVLAQERFTYLPAPADAGRQRWQVPVALRLQAGGVVRTDKRLLAGAEERLELSGALDWVIVNAGGHGYYRVRYAPPLLGALAARAAAVATPIERFNLVNDAWASTAATRRSSIRRCSRRRSRSPPPPAGPPSTTTPCPASGRRGPRRTSNAISTRSPRSASRSSRRGPSSERSTATFGRRTRRSSCARCS